MSSKPTGNQAALEASLARFRSRFTFKALERARAAIVAGSAIEERDRDFIVMTLELARADELARLKALTPSVLKAYATDFICRDIGVTVDRAAAFVADESATAAAIKQSLKKIRRESGWRQQEKQAKRSKRSQKVRARS